jgi:hypothetical protein
MEHARQLNVGGVARFTASFRVAVDARRRAADDGARPRRPLLERVLLDERPDLLVATFDLLLAPDQARQLEIASSILG